MSLNLSTGYAANFAVGSPAANEQETIHASDPKSFRSPEHEFEDWLRSPPEADNEGMPDVVSRPELDAKFEALRADMRADRAEMRLDFESLRKDMATMVGDVKAATGAIDGKVGRIEGVVEGMNKSLTTHKWVVTTLLALTAAFIAWMQFKEPPAQATPPPSPPPVIQNFTGVAPTPLPAPSQPK